MSDAVVRGRLKIFLSYAAGAGKTYRMLVEGHRLRQSGVDVVLACFNPHVHGRTDTVALTIGLKTVRPRTRVVGGTRFEDIDTDAVIRRPRVALVDELPHTNAPGSPRAKRWEDVQVLLEAGVDVVTNMNVTHVESLTERIRQTTGVVMRQTIPDLVLVQADEIVMVDVEPETLLNRLQRGLIYPPARAKAVLDTFFREKALIELREVARRYAIGRVQSDD